MNRWKVIWVMLVMMLLVSGCSSKSVIDWEKEGDPFEQIKVEIISQSETNEGKVIEIGIHNEINLDIVDLNVALSYPIIREIGMLKIQKFILKVILKRN